MKPFNICAKHFIGWNTRLFFNMAIYSISISWYFNKTVLIWKCCFKLKWGLAFWKYFIFESLASSFGALSHKIKILQLSFGVNFSLCFQIFHRAKPNETKIDTKRYQFQIFWTVSLSNKKKIENNHEICEKYVHLNLRIRIRRLLQHFNLLYKPFNGNRQKSEKTRYKIVIIGVYLYFQARSISWAEIQTSTVLMWF